MLNVGLLLYDDVELLDFAGPYEVFTTASRVAHLLNQPSPFTTRTHAQTTHIRARAGLTIVADAGLDDAPIDLLIVPGGVTDDAQKNPALVPWLAQAADKARCVASVCTGAFLLAEAGLLDQRPVTTHWEDIEALQAQFPSLRLERDVRFIDHGALATSAGISAGIDLALHLVARFASPQLATATAKQMDYHSTTHTHKTQEGIVYGLL